MSLHNHRQPSNAQGIRGAHGPVPNQPIVGPENPHGNDLGRHHEMFVHRQNQQRRQNRPQPMPAARPDIPRPGPEQPATDNPNNHNGPAPAGVPALPAQTVSQNGFIGGPQQTNTAQLAMPLLEGQAMEVVGNEAVKEGYGADDEKAGAQDEYNLRK